MAPRDGKSVQSIQSQITQPQNNIQIHREARDNRPSRPHPSRPRIRQLQSPDNIPIISTFIISNVTNWVETADWDGQTNDNSSYSSMSGLERPGDGMSRVGRVGRGVRGGRPSPRPAQRHSAGPNEG